MKKTQFSSVNFLILPVPEHGGQPNIILKVKFFSVMSQFLGTTMTSGDLFHLMNLNPIEDHLDSELNEIGSLKRSVFQSLNLTTN